MCHPARIRVGLDMHRVGMQDDVHVFGPGQVVTVLESERFLTLIKLPEARPEQFFIERRLPCADFMPETFIIHIATQAQHFVCTAIVLSQRVRSERPAAVRYPVASFKVRIVEQRTTPSPDMDRSAEESETGVFERIIGHTRAGASVERLAFLLEIIAAGLKQTHRVPLFCQFSGERDAGRACANDTDVSTQVLTVGHLQKITQQVDTASSW